MTQPESQLCAPKESPWFENRRTASGRVGLFTKSLNGRCVRKGDISDRGGGRRSWAASSHRSKDGPRKRKSIGSPQWRCNLFIEFAVPAWLDADEH